MERDTMVDIPDNHPQARKCSHTSGSLLLALLALTACGPAQSGTEIPETPNSSSPSDHMEPAPTHEATTEPKPPPESTPDPSPACFPETVSIDGTPYDLTWFQSVSTADYTDRTFRDDPNRSDTIAVLDDGSVRYEIVVDRVGVAVKAYGDHPPLAVGRTDDPYVQVLLVDGVPVVVLSACDWDLDQITDPSEVGIAGIDGSLAPFYLDQGTPEVQGWYKRFMTPLW